MDSSTRAEVVSSASVADRAAGTAPWLARGVAWTLVAVAVALLIGSCVGFVGRYWWGFDLTNHFRVQFLTVAVLGTFLAGLLRQWVPSLLFLVCVTVNACLVCPLYVGGQHAEETSEPLRVLSINVNAGNRAQAEVLRTIQEGDPDVFFVLEFNAYWQTALASLEARYPFTHQIPQQDNFGIAVYSRLPCDSLRPFFLQRPGFGAIELQVHHAARTWTLLGVHVMPPVSAGASALRNQQFAELAQRVRGRAGPLVVLGDLNSTSWSPFFRRLLATSGLGDSQLGYGVQPTWPEQLPMLKIPIDHCLVSPDVRIGRRWLTRGMGSDHRGVFVELGAAARTDQSRRP